MADDIIDISNTSSADEGEPPVSITAQTRSKLHLAITTTPEARLRQIIRDLVDSNPELELELVQKLVTVKKKSRKVMPKWEQCTKCKESFDASLERDEEECTYHSGQYIFPLS